MTKTPSEISTTRRTLALRLSWSFALIPRRTALPLSALSTRAPVLRAIEEFDALGRAAFLEKYGFGPARAYHLVFNGRRYDSKAILGAAHGYARPDLGPMSAAQFSGGRATVMTALERLGFEVSAADETPEAAAAFLLTWKASGWPHENLVRMVETLQAQGYVDEPWRLRSFRKAAIGDPVWLLKQGPGPKVIFGQGRILDAPTRRDAGNGKVQPMATMRFSRLVDPEDACLIDDVTTHDILDANQITAQASGDPIRPEQAAALALAAGPPPSAMITPEHASDDAFDPANLQDARDRVLREIAQRRGQKAFRDALLRAYGGRCAVTDCDVKDVLEAAHIVPYLGPATNRTENGLLLRADIHTLFDCGLITIDPTSRTVVVAARLLTTDYGPLHGKPLRTPSAMSDAPSLGALTRRSEMANGPR